MEKFEIVLKFIENEHIRFSNSKDPNTITTNRTLNNILAFMNGLKRAEYGAKTHKQIRNNKNSFVRLPE